MLKSRIGLPGLSLALAVFTLGTTTTVPGETSAPAGGEVRTPLADDATTQVAGKSLFEGKGMCFTCHGKDGKGTVLAPNLTDGEWLQFEERPTAAALIPMITAGVARPVKHPAPMPPMGGARLNEEEMAALAAYVLQLSATGIAARPPT